MNCQIYFAVGNTRFLQSKEVCEVDVFDHPRFCDEFSHLVNKHVEEPATLCWSLNWMKYTFETIKNILLNCQIYFAVANTRFLQSKEVCEVDVFEHPRFCDEFSNLVNRHVVKPATLCWSPIWMEYTFETI